MFSKLFLVMTAVAVAVNAQSSDTTTSAPTIPTGLGLTPCILACVGPAATQNNCAFTDAACVCASAQFQADAALCLSTNCTPDDLAAALALQTSQCNAVGVSATSSATPNTVPFTLSTTSGGTSSTNTAPTTTGSSTSSLPITGSPTPSPSPSIAAGSSLKTGAGAFFGAVLAGVLAL